MKTKPKTVLVGVRLNREMKRRLAAAAKRLGVSRAAVVRLACQEAISGKLKLKGGAL